MSPKWRARSQAKHVSENYPKCRMRLLKIIEGLIKNLLHFRLSDNTSKQDSSEAAFQVIGYRKPGGKVIHEHWV